MTNAPPTEQKTKPKRKRNALFIVAFILVLAGGGVLGGHFFVQSLHYEWTDDAFLDATVTVINPQLAARVNRVYVVDNQPVKAGELLVELDRSLLEAQLAEVEAEIELSRARKATAELNVGLTRETTGADIDQFQAQVDAAHAAVLEANASVEAAQSDAERAAQDADRFEHLLKDDAISAQERDTAVTASRVANARLAEAHKRLSRSEAELHAAEAQLTQAKTGPQQIAVTESEVEQHAAEIAQAEASKRHIEVDLSHTKLFAPADGVVAMKRVHEGEYVQPGQSLMTVVHSDLYVEANFKETQLTNMRPGQPVEVEVDAFKGRIFTAHVDSIQSGTGSLFSLLPPQNATGNYVKVVQRVPVKIVFDEPLPDDLPLVPGMSVVPKVRVK